MLARAATIAALAAAVAGSASASDSPSGAYTCTVEQKAGIAEEHMEGAPRPKAFIDEQAAHFRIRVTPPGKRAKANVEELKHTILRGTYAGTDGWRFTSPDGQAFLRLDVANSESGWLFFYHAGFEKTDAYNENLSVRSGTCAPAK